MKLNRLEKTFILLLLVIFGGIVVHAPLSVGLGTLFPDYSLLIKAWKEILLVAGMMLAVVIVTRRKLWKELLGDWIVRLIAAFAALHLFLVVAMYKGAAATAAGLSIDLRFFLFFSLVYTAVKIAPQYRRRFLQIGVAGACVVVGFAALQLFLPRDILSHIGYGDSTIQPYLTVDKNPAFVRENSTLRGPNPLGAYAGIVLSCLTAVWVRKKEWLKTNGGRRIGYAVLTACALVALWVSYSRSALLAGIFGVLSVLAVSVARKLSRTAWIASCIVLAVLAGGLAMAKGSDFVSNVILHENPNGGSSVSSNEGHVESLVTSWDRFVRQPLGGGVGSTGSASLFSGTDNVIENQYLFVAHEAGWLGLLLSLVIYGSVLARLWSCRQDWLALGTFASGIALALIGLLLPVWVDDTVSIIWWGMAAIALGGKYARHTAK
jgi:general stress protein CsbA